jgi:protein-S-isoprenylcysteine O-methyltransferase Ste14
MALPRMEGPVNDGFIQRGGLWVIAQGAIMVTIAILGMTWRAEAAPFAVRVGGLVFLTISALCGILGVMALGRGLTPFPKPSAGARFVQNGIYSVIRHPLYTSVIFAAFGWSLFRSSWAAFVTSLALAVFFDFKARREERWLQEKFPEYASYAQRVRRFIPWVY